MENAPYEYNDNTHIVSLIVKGQVAGWWGGRTVCMCCACTCTGRLPL